MTQTLLSLDGVTKAYPGVVANDDVALQVGHGDVHALLGENGAGKSTLVKMIYGLVKPDSGTMTLMGHPYAPPEPRAARAAGVAMVFQHFSLFNALSVAENIALGMEAPPAQRDLAAQIKTVSETYGLPLDPYRTVGNLSAGERQRVEIIRCLLQNPKLLIMDEPTSVLTPQEVDILFTTLKKLSAAGTAILYISHKLDEIRQICDRATILRRGKNVGYCRPAETTARDLAEMMVGSSFTSPTRKPREIGDVVLHLNDLSLPAPSAFGTALKHINLTVKAGEIIGIGGVAGNGQDELLSALSGEVKATADSVVFNGTSIGDHPPGQRRSLRVFSAPEERLGHAAVPDMSLVENTLISTTSQKDMIRNGFINWPKAREFAEQVIEAFDVRTPGASSTAQALSGGNLQKFVIGREVLQAPQLLVVNQPTWGVDAAAAAAIRQALLDLAHSGAALIVISQDLDELLEICDYFGALNAGSLSDTRPVEGLKMDQIGLMMGGADSAEAPQ